MIDEERLAKEKGAGGGEGHSQIDDRGKGSASNVAQNDAAERRAKPSDLRQPGGSGSTASTGDLWGQIKPCWDRLPAVSTAPVTLVIALDERGRIAKPPKIIRPNAAAPDERRLISEARALAAVTACVPYRVAGLPGSRQIFTVRFGMAD